MLQMFVITLREGIEAFLIVAIALAYLRKTGRNSLVPAVLWGTAAGVMLSVLLGVKLAQFAVQPIWEGILALVTSALVVTFTLHVLRAAKFLKRQIEGRLERAAASPAAWWSVFAFTVLMITREGMEAALLLVSTAMQSTMQDFFVGAVLGLACAAAVAALWGRFGHRVPLARFLQVTAIFLLLFVVQLAIYAFHELTEAAVLPLDNEYWHLATEPYGPEGVYGHWLSYGLIAVPLAWLLFASLKGRDVARSA